MPPPLPANQMNMRQRFSAMRNIAPFMREIWATSKGMTLQLVTYDGDMWWNRAVAAGCTVTMPFTEQFWGDRYGRLRDPFGLDWAINEPGKGKG